jgi:cell wall-associated NlpC family hydrolase
VASPCGANSRADQAISWFQARFGDTSYHGVCETAVENAYGNTFRYGSALQDWNTAVNQGRAHRGDLHAPRGALVFWDISKPDGHVGISRGDGTFVATDVNGAAIGAAPLPYYPNYLGWAYPNS